MHICVENVYIKNYFKRPIAKKLTFLTSSWNVDGTVIQNFNKINCCHYIHNEEISVFKLLNGEIKFKNFQAKTYIMYIVTFYKISNANHSYLWVGVEEQKCWIAKKWNSKWVPLQPTWLVGRQCIIPSSQKWKEAWQSKGFLEEIEKVDRYKKIFVTKYENN